MGMTSFQTLFVHRYIHFSLISEFQNFIYEDSYIGQPPQPRIAAGALCPIYESSYIKICNSDTLLMSGYKLDMAAPATALPTASLSCIIPAKPDTPDFGSAISRP